MDFNVGDEVDFLGMRSIIKYIGPHDKKPGTWIGVELPKPKGKNNGTIQGKKYFECEENHGVFVQEEVFLGAMERSKQQAIARNQIFKNKSVPTSPSTNITPTKIDDKLKQTPSSMPISAPLPDKKLKPSPPQPEKLLASSSTESLSELFPIYEQIDKAKSEFEHYKLKYNSEKQKYDQASSQLVTMEQNFKELCTNFQNQLEEKLDMISLEGLKQKIEIEDQIYKNLIREEELQKITMMTAPRIEIESLEQISEQHKSFEASLLDISKEFAKNLDRNARIKKDLDKKLNFYQTEIQKCIDQENSALDTLQEYQTQIDGNYPVLIQSKNLNIQLEQLSNSIKASEQLNTILSAQNDEIKNFIPLIQDVTKESFIPVLICKRLQKKIPLLPVQNEITEQLLHFCQISILFLSSEILEANNINLLVSELEKIESSVSNFQIPKIDIETLQLLLQKYTQHAISQAITSNLILSYAYRVKDSNLKSDLRQLSKLVHGVIHPLTIPKYRDECDSLAIELRDVLRKAEKGENVQISHLENKISLLLLSSVDTSSYDFIKSSKSDEKQDKLIFVEHEMMPELRRRMRDAEALCKTYANHINFIKNQLNEN